MTPEERAAQWLVNNGPTHIRDDAHLRTLATLIREAEARGRLAGLEEAADMLATERAYWATRDHSGAAACENVEHAIGKALGKVRP
jgi:hypothetical protein